MLNREAHPQYYEESNEILSSLLELPIPRDILSHHDATWFMTQREHFGVDVRFEPHTGGGADLVGVTGLFDLRDCVGVAYKYGAESYTDVYFRLQQNEWLKKYLDLGASVAILDTQEMGKWHDFYEQVVHENWLSQLGPRVLGYSGLGVMDVVQIRGLWTAMDRLIKRDLGGWANVDNSTPIAIESAGSFAYAPSVDPPGGPIGYDVMFMDDFGTVGSVLMKNVRVMTGLRGQILEEQVIPSSSRVYGWVVPRPGENKRDAYARAEELRRYSQGQSPGESVTVPVISDGQLSLWRKLSSVRPVEASIAHDGISAGLTVDEVIRYLFLGDSNLEWHPFSAMGLSLPSKAVEIHGLDIVFYGRRNGFQRDYRAVNNMVSWDLKKLKKGKREVTALNNVGGIILLPDEMDVEEMKKRVRAAQSLYNRVTSGTDKNILILTPQLFSIWQEMNTPIFGSSDMVTVQGDIPLRQRAKYGYGVGVGARHNLVIFQSKAQVGGNQIMVTEERGNEKLGHLIDFGLNFETSRPFLQRASTATGIRTQLESSQIPLLPGAYDKWYILATAAYNMGVLGNETGVIPSYLRSEIVKREMGDELAQLIGWVQTRQIIDMGARDAERWYGQYDKTVATLTMTHAHLDHVGSAPFTDRDMRWYGFAETFAYLTARSKKANSYDSKYEHVLRIAGPRGSGGYERAYRDWRPVLRSGEPIHLSDSLIARLYMTNHSIGGSGMVGISTSDGTPLVLLTGDFNMGRRTIETAENLAGKYPVIVTESTNSEEWEKPSTGITSQMVYDTMYSLMKKYQGQGLVVVIPPNNLRRLALIQEIASRVGRRVAIGPEMAEVVHQLHVARDNISRDDVDGFDQPLPRIGEDVGLWWAPITQPQTYRTLLREAAEKRLLGVVDSARLSRESGGWIVVVTPYRTLGDDFGNAHFPRGLQVLHSAYFPYEPSSQLLIMNNTRWLQKFGGNGLYHADFIVSGAKGRRVRLAHNYAVDFEGEYGLHSSGHGTFDGTFAVLTALTNGWQPGHNLVLIHGNHPKSYAMSLIERITDVGGHMPHISFQLGQYNAAEGKLRGHVMALS